MLLGYSSEMKSAPTLLRQLFHKCSAYSARAILRTTYNTTLESVLHQTSEYSSLRRQLHHRPRNLCGRNRGPYRFAGLPGAMKSDRTDKLILFAFDLLWLSDEWRTHPGRADT